MQELKFTDDVPTVQQLEATLNATLIAVCWKQLLTIALCNYE